VFFKPKPHVSDALRHLRVTVVACAVIVGVCISLQTLVWGFVHFTDARWQEVEEVVNEASVSVVPSPTGQTGSISGRTMTTQPKPMTTQSVRINRVLSRSDGWFGSIVGLTSTLGLLAAVVLAISMFQGVVIAGGGSVPGVEKAVTASTWSIIVALICAPLGEIVPAFPFSGVFTPYAALTEASEAVRQGLPGAPAGASFYAEHLVLPLIAFAGVIFIVTHFLAGIEEGVIATSVNELDEKLAKEMASIKSVAGNQPRSIGALNQAMGDRGSSESKPASPAKPAASGAPEKRLNAPNPGAPLSRPI
jgi:hypothetical protein